MKKHLLFDFDGVIVANYDLNFSINKGLCPDLTHEMYQAVFAGNIYETLKVDWVTEEHKANDYQAFFDAYEPGMKEIDPVEEVVAALEDLDQGKTIVTSGREMLVEDYLGRHAIDHHFNDIWGAETEKSKVKKFRMALEKYRKRPNEVLFITDTLGDLLEAKEAGIPAIGVTWGFHGPEYLEQGDPLHIIEKPEDFHRDISKHL